MYNVWLQSEEGSNIEETHDYKTLDYVGKECKKKLPSFMDLMKHLSTHHVKKPCEEVEVKGLVDKEFKDKNMGEKEEVFKEDKDKSCVISESMLDEFIS